MSIRRLCLLAGLAMAALAPASAPAQQRQGQANPAPRAPTRAELDRSAANFRVFVSALQDNGMPERVKSGLFICVHSFPFGRISADTDRLLSQRDWSRSDPNLVLRAMIHACGVPPPPAGQR